MGFAAWAVRLGSAALIVGGVASCAPGATLVPSSNVSAAGAPPPPAVLSPELRAAFAAATSPARADLAKVAGKTLDCAGRPIEGVRLIDELSFGADGRVTYRFDGKMGEISRRSVLKAPGLIPVGCTGDFEGAAGIGETIRLDQRCSNIAGTVPMRREMTVALRDGAIYHRLVTSNPSYVSTGGVAFSASRQTVIVKHVCGADGTCASDTLYHFPTPSAQVRAYVARAKKQGAGCTLR